jgi:hypothetical protein
MKSSRKRKIALLISISLFAIGIILSNTYRVYIYGNNIFDYHIADTIGSWLCIPAASLFLWGIQPKYSFAKFIAVSLIAFTIYEFFISSTFDYYDLIAQFLSGGLTYLTYLVSKKLMRYD